MRFEIYESPGTQFGGSWNGKFIWYWRLRARNGRIIADGAEAYGSKHNVKRAIRRLQEAVLYAGRPLDIKEVDS